jgi:hypothetical protein
MRKLLLAPILAAALFIGFAVAPSQAAKLPGPILEDTCACGGTVYVLWTLVTWPNGYNNPAWCERHWSHGVVTYSPCD